MVYNSGGLHMDTFLNTVLSCRDEELDTIITERIVELESSMFSDSKIIIPNENKYDYTSHYIGFIKSDVSICFSMDYNPLACYTLGNYECIFEFFKKVRELNITSNGNLVKYLSSFLDDYFGLYNGTDKRDEYLMKLGGNATIDCFRGKGLAACSERAAIANNILEMIGLRSIYVTGSVNNIQHAFNVVINSKNSFLIVDTSAACGLYDTKDNMIGSATYSFNLGSDTEKLRSLLGDEVAFKAIDCIVRKQEDGTLKYEGNNKSRVYTIEPIRLEKEKLMKH